MDRLARRAAQQRLQQLSDGLANNTTEKQAMAAALILAADCMATQWIFEDSDILTVDAIADFLKSKEAVSAADRGYQYMCDWVALNAGKLQGAADGGEVYGIIEDGWAYIIRSVFNRACADNGINAQALLSHLKTRGLIKVRKTANTVGKRIGKLLTEGVAMKLPSDTFEEMDSDEPTPFE